MLRTREELLREGAPWLVVLVGYTFRTEPIRFVNEESSNDVSGSKLMLGRCAIGINERR